VGAEQIFIPIKTGLPHVFTPVSFSAHSTLNMEAIFSSETAINFLRTTERYIAQNSIPVFKKKFDLYFWIL
jgi:hypothetical protein